MYQHSLRGKDGCSSGFGSGNGSVAPVPLRFRENGSDGCGSRFRFRFLSHPALIGNGPNTVSGSTVSNTELSEFFGAH